jgi:hypothetical protein
MCQFHALQDASRPAYEVDRRLRLRCTGLLLLSRHFFASRKKPGKANDTPASRLILLFPCVYIEGMQTLKCLSASHMFSTPEMKQEARDAPFQKIL